VDPTESLTVENVFGVVSDWYLGLVLVMLEVKLEAKPEVKLEGRAKLVMLMASL
jgi:hypothetical protein